MALKLFILGLPGSGKSTVSRLITEYTKPRDWKILHFSDHVILKEMFLADSEHKQFKPTEHGGFDVFELTVRDVALQELERRLKRYCISAKQEEIILIEFARNDYRWAFQQFSDEFLYNAYFLYLDVEVDICKRRIQKRIANPISDDDFYVSEYIFSTYYNQDDGRSISQVLASDHGIDVQKIKIIDNNGFLSDSISQINQFVDSMCGFETL